MPPTQTIVSLSCEIYVPERIIDGHFVNLHKYYLEKVFDIKEDEKESNIHNMLQYIFDNVKDIKPDINIHSLLIDISTNFYEKGVSGIDIIKVIQTMNNWTEYEIVNIVMCFQKIKSEFRCEKMIIFYILDFLFFNANADLKNISFI